MYELPGHLNSWQWRHSAAGGSAASALFLERLLASRAAALPSLVALKDSKTRLQEWLQGQGLALPVYAVEAVTGEPHAQLFRVRCEVATHGLVTVAEGPSRRRAEQLAAEAALGRLAAQR